LTFMDRNYYHSKEWLNFLSNHVEVKVQFHVDAVKEIYIPIETEINDKTVSEALHKRWGKDAILDGYTYTGKP